MAEGWPIEEALSLKVFMVGDPAIDRARSIVTHHQQIAPTRGGWYSRGVGYHAGCTVGSAEGPSDSSREIRGGSGGTRNNTSTAGLSLFAALQNLLFQLLGTLLIFLVAALTQFPNAQQEVIYVLGPIGVGGDRHSPCRPPKGPANSSGIVEVRKDEGWRFRKGRSGRVEDSRAEVFSALLKLNGDGRDHRNSLAPPIIIAHPCGTFWLSTSALCDLSTGR